MNTYAGGFFMGVLHECVYTGEALNTFNKIQESAKMYNATTGSAYVINKWYMYGKFWIYINAKGYMHCITMGRTKENLYYCIDERLTTKNTLQECYRTKYMGRDEFLEFLSEKSEISMEALATYYKI